jgi:hypothetical protein
VTDTRRPWRLTVRLRTGGSVWIEPGEAGSPVLHWHIAAGFLPWPPLSWGAPIFVRVFQGIVQPGVDELARQLNRLRPRSLRR